MKLARYVCWFVYMKRHVSEIQKELFERTNKCTPVILRTSLNASTCSLLSTANRSTYQYYCVVFFFFQKRRQRGQSAIHTVVSLGVPARHGHRVPRLQLPVHVFELARLSNKAQGSSLTSIHILRLAD